MLQKTVLLAWILCIPSYVHAQESAMTGNEVPSLRNQTALQSIGEKQRRALDLAGNQIRQNDLSGAIKTIEDVKHNLSQAETIDSTNETEYAPGGGGNSGVQYIPDFGQLSNSTKKELQCGSEEHVVLLDERTAKCERHP